MVAKTGTFGDAKRRSTVLRLRSTVPQESVLKAQFLRGDHSTELRWIKSTKVKG